MTGRSVITAFAALMLGSSAIASQLPNYDAVADAPRIDAASQAGVRAALASSSPSRVQWDDRFGVPTFVWPAAKKPVTAASVLSARSGTSVDAAARQYLEEYSGLYGLTPADVADAYVANVHDTGSGPIIVKLRQKIGNVDVFRDEMNVVLDRDHQLVALSGHISALPRTSRISAMSVKPAGFLLTASAAIRSAASDAEPQRDTLDVNALRFLGNADGGYQLYDNGSNDAVRAKQVYFHLIDRYEPSYYVELYTGGDETSSNELYGYVVSAIDGRVLFRNSLTADQAAPAAYTYRVWASPSGDHPPLSGPQGYDGTPNPTSTLDGYQPVFIAPALIALSTGPISTKDPWLATDATETVGNNADAYVDLVAPDGLSSSDFRATVSSALSFDRTYDISRVPATTRDQQMAAITQLFYDVNFLHDWYYDAGFNEAAANAQTSNFGRGGVENDSIRAEAQDYSGRNNANMSTPSDGGHPRMQMYVWDGAGNRNLRVDAPSSIAKSYITGGANFGPTSFDLTGEVVATTPADACDPITSNVSGKIAFIDRGGSATCTFSLKTLNAKNAGAIGVIIGSVPSSTSPDSIVTMACAGSTACTAAEATYPPALLVALSDANAFRAAAASGIRVLMHRDAAVDRDGTIDNQIVAHEWMHYMSNRLVANSAGLVNQQARGMGEGWADFNALLMTTRPDDTRFPSNDSFQGSYATAVYVTTGGSNGPLLNNGTYYGIRRVPYSTDLSRDPLTLKHVMNGIPISGAPVRVNGDGANNAEVHATGEVWCSMLWEAYASLLRDTLGSTPRLTFAQAQQRMKEYLVASLKITPPSPTILEARDAVLAAAFARDKTDYQRFWQAFAKRGAGFDSVPPERYSSTNAGAREDFNGSGGMTVTGVQIDDDISSCLKNGILDAGETGAIKIALKNIGGVRLEATTLSVVSSDSSLSLANAGAVSVPPSDPGETVVAAVNATLANATAIVKPDLTIKITDPQITTAGGMTNVYLARINAYDIPKDATTDDVEASTTPWTTAQNGGVKWTRTEVSARDHRWLAPEPWNAVDISLVSPPLMVAPAGNFSFTFRHRFAFDYAVSGAAFAIDGGVIELSTDNGLTWTDIGNKIDKSTVSYGNVPILTGNGSVIEGRRAFISSSPNFNYDLPSKTPFSTTTVALGTDYANKRVRIRFRVVTGGDHSTAPRQGWEIDDIAFTNIMNLPFATLTPDTGLCGVSATITSLSASVLSVTNGQPITFTAAVGSSVAPAGSVDFFDNGAILASVHVQNGAATLTTGALTPGAHTITASFNGTKYRAPSASAGVDVQVGIAGRHRAVGK